MFDCFGWKRDVNFCAGVAYGDMLLTSSSLIVGSKKPRNSNVFNVAVLMLSSCVGVLGGLENYFYYTLNVLLFMVSQIFGVSVCLWSVCEYHWAFKRVSVV